MCPKLAPWQTWTLTGSMGAVTASLMSTTSCNIMWQFILGQHLAMDMWADYKLLDNLCIDSACMTDTCAVLLEPDGATWTINFNTTTQGAHGLS